MLKLKNYSFSGIGRFVEKQTIDLESRDNLIQIDGENQNTGGSSGAGKSTTVEALAYLLGISDIPSTALQSRISNAPIWVQGEFEGGITITRSKKDGLTIETPEGTVSGGSKLAEERLDEIIGVNRSLLKTMCYKRQKQGGFFLNLTPKESHNFLVDCLDLKDMQSKIFKLEDILKNQYKPEKIRKEAEVNVLIQSIEQLDMLLTQKIEPTVPELIDTTSMETKIQVLRQTLEGERLNFDTIVSRNGTKPQKSAGVVFEKDQDLQYATGQINALKAAMRHNETVKTTAIDQAASAIVSIREKITEASALVQRMDRLQIEVGELVESGSHLTSGNCPTCLREWEKEKLQNKLEDIELQINNKKELIQKFRLDVEKIPHFKMMQEKATEILESKRKIIINVEEEKSLAEAQERQRLLLNEKDNIQEVENNKYLEALNKWTMAFNIAKDAFNKKEFEVLGEVQSIESQIKQNNIKKDSYTMAIDTFNRDVINIKTKRNESYSKLSKNQEELRKLEKDIVLSEESIRLIKNFTLQKFQDTLDYIGIRATEIINQIPNMANAVIFFENAKETQSGKIKNEVNAVINLEGDTEVPIKTLSGGERTSADFAIDLAVGEMIENMTKKGVNFLIIDEGFDGLDSISKIQCLEILKTLNTDKKIMMVDHSSEVKEMVCDIIKVVRIKEESHIL